MNRDARTLREFARGFADGAGPLGIIPGRCQRKAHHDSLHLILFREAVECGEGHTLSGSPSERGQRLGDGTGGIADRDAHASFPEVDSQNSHILLAMVPMDLYNGSDRLLYDAENS